MGECLSKKIKDEFELGAIAPLHKVFPRKAGNPLLKLKLHPNSLKGGFRERCCPTNDSMMTRTVDGCRLATVMATGYDLH